MPSELWNMTLWEFNICVDEYINMTKELAEEKLTLCWQTAAFTGASFSGKLRKLSHYKKDSNQTIAPKINKNEFEQKLAMAKRVSNYGTEKSKS